tara:strand:- start:10 stop:738 length:729 start_codon:yes stop_codon:yes gene_type:complete
MDDIKPKKFVSWNLLENKKYEEKNKAINIEDLNRHEFINTFEANLTTQVTDPYIYVDTDALSKSICDEIIQKFEAEPYNQYNGITGGGLNLKTKKTKEINVTRCKGWKKYDEILHKNLSLALTNYSINCIKKCLNREIYHLMQSNGKFNDTGYQIQKYLKNDGHYVWHQDSSIDYKNKKSRVVTYLWYLNDVDEGGETFFYHCKVKPEKGKLIIFPACWNYNHCGNTPTSNDKYIITGWVYA